MVPLLYSSIKPHRTFLLHVLDNLRFKLYTDGDPIDPDADIAAMRNLKNSIIPGGLLYLAVPVGEDTILWNQGRIYGKLRLPRLLEGWDLVGTFHGGGITDEKSASVEISASDLSNFALDSLWPTLLRKSRESADKEEEYQPILVLRRNH